jgi:hypothetical protein
MQSRPLGGRLSMFLLLFCGVLCLFVASVNKRAVPEFETQELKHLKIVVFAA